MPILVTGAAGFIGFHVAKALLDRGERVVGIDNINDYYDPKLKHDRLALLRRHAGFEFEQIDVADRAATERLFSVQAFERVVHLAAQAGVRHSIDHPHVYAASNLTGFLHILEGCRHAGTAHLVYASSSSVYGANEKLPFAVSDSVDHPVSLYAATKKANELMAHSYAHLYGLPASGLRFFTVYGPWGRPDMALFRFVRAMLAGETIDVYGEGRQSRDFTYIDDIVAGVLGVLDRPPVPDPTRTPSDPSVSKAPYRVCNIGNNRPTDLLDFVAAIETALGVSAKVRLLPMQPGDVAHTYADISALSDLTGFAPKTPLEDGIARFVAWYRDYYRP